MLATAAVQAEDELELTRDLALAIGEAETAEHALRATLRIICERTGWPLGQAWLPGAAGHLECGTAWFAQSEGLAEFRRLSEAFIFPPGIGLPGKALATGEPAWAGDLSEASEFSRAPFAKQAGRFLVEVTLVSEVALNHLFREGPRVNRIAQVHASQSSQHVVSQRS